MCIRDRSPIQAVWWKVQFLALYCQWATKWSNIHHLCNAIGPLYRLNAEKCNFCPHFTLGPPDGLLCRHKVQFLAPTLQVGYQLNIGKCKIWHHFSYCATKWSIQADWWKLKFFTPVCKWATQLRKNADKWNFWLEVKH